MKRLLVILILFTGFISLSQTDGFKRQFKFPGAFNNTSKAIFETTPGHYIAGGLIVETYNNKTSNRLAIMGLDSAGHLQWVKKYGDYYFEYLDNPLIAKWFYRSGNSLYYTGCVRDTNNKQFGVLIKFDLNGDTLWQKIYKDNTQDIIPQQVTSSVEGGFLITGFAQTTNTSPCLLIKTDAHGNELWRKTISKTTPNVADGKVILQDSASKKIIIVGYQYIGSSTSWSPYDHLLILDSLGNKIVQKNYIGNYVSGLGGQLLDLIQTNDKKFVAVGNITHPKQIGGNNLRVSFAFKFDINAPNIPTWVIDNYDPPGSDNQFTCITETSSGDLIIGGVLDTMVTHNLNTKDLLRLLRVNQSGQILSKRYYDYKSNSLNDSYYQTMNGINKTSDGGFITAIQLSNSPNPNPFFFVKYNFNLCDSTDAYCEYISGLNHYGAESEAVKVWPNPTTDFLNIDFKNHGSLATALYDIFGREVKQMRIEPGQKLDLHELSAGLYTLKLKDESGKPIYQSKVVKAQ